MLELQLEKLLHNQVSLIFQAKKSVLVLATFLSIIGASIRVKNQ